MDYLIQKLWLLKPYIQAFTDDWLHYTLVIIFPIVMVYIIFSAIIDVCRWFMEDDL